MKHVSQSTFNRIRVSLILAVLLGIVMEQIVFAQGAKIHRKTALLSVQPAVLTEGRSFSVTAQVYEPLLTTLRLSVTTPEGDLQVQEILQISESFVTKGIRVPGSLKGRMRVILEADRHGRWIPVAEESIVLLPDFYDQVLHYIGRIEAMERNAAPNSKELRNIWAGLAYAEDLLERMKTANGNHVMELLRRLTALRKAAQAIENKKDPLTDTNGYQLRGYRSEENGEMQLYSVYKPKAYDAEKAWPLVLMLHGAWSNHHLALRRVLGHSNRRGENDPDAKQFMPPLPDVPYLIVAPNGYETMSYEGFAEKDVWRVMDEMNLLFNVDPDRVYVTGLSMGGAGTSKIGFRHPDRFAAAAPVCGFFSPGLWRSEDEKIPDFQRRLESMSSTHDVAENLLHVPVKIMHGDADPVVPPKGSVALHARLKELGYNTELEMYPGVDHAAWVPAYENARIFDWFAQFKRDPAPKKVIFKTGSPYGGGAYWIAIQEPERIRQFAQVNAEIDENTVSIKTENTARLSVSVPEKWIPNGDPLRVVIDGGAVLEGSQTGKELHFIHQNGKWEKGGGDYTPPLLPGNAGIHEARLSRQVFSYGTAGSEEETAECRQLAMIHSMPASIADERWALLPEEDLAPLQDQYNIILYSTIHGSAYLQKHLNQLPFQVNGEEIEFAGRIIKPNQALSIIYPNPENPKRYIAIYTAATREGLKALRANSSASRDLEGGSSGDFIVFSNDGKPAWGGLFDKEWKVDVVGDF